MRAESGRQAADRASEAVQAVGTAEVLTKAALILPA